MKRKRDSTPWCGAINCKASKAQCPELSFFRFPPQPERSKVWVQMCRREDLRGRSTEYLSENVKLCSKHFEASQFYPNNPKRLKMDSVPTIFDVPNPPKPITPRRALVVRQEHQLVKSDQGQGAEHRPDWGGLSTILDEHGQHMDENTPAAVVEGTCSLVQQPLSRQPTAPHEEKAHQGVESGVERALREAKAEAKTLRQRLASQGKVLRKYQTRCRRHKLKLEERKGKKQPISSEDALKKLEEICPPRLFKVVQLQMKLAGTKPRGRRYSDEELMEWLAVYHMGARSYRQLSRLFIMPSPRMLRKRMQDIQMLPGFQEALLSALQNKMRNAPANEKMVVISFDEIQLTPKLTYHPGPDNVEGTEDFGELGKTSRVADHALTFMVRGLTGGWKQPVGYFYSAGPAPAAVLEHQLKACVRKLRAAGLRVVCTVCDMGKPNQELLKRKLGVTVARPYFEVDGECVIAMYDPPHLIKCLRNCLYKHDIQTPEGVMSWAHIKEFYEEDRGRSVRAAPRLRDAHIVLGAFSRMKVKLATQVFSKSVASGMHLFADVGLLESNCKVTAGGLLRLNDAFDVLNSSRVDPNPNRRPFSKETERSHMQVLTDLKEWLNLWSIDGRTPSADNIQGLQLTISAVLLMWQTVSGDLQSLCTRRLNQDGLENFFGLVRQVNGGNYKPDPFKFRCAFRKTAVGNVLLPSQHTNCEPDVDGMMAALTSVAARTSRPVPAATVNFCGVPPPPVVGPCVDHVEANVLTYISGYLAYRASRKHPCGQCMSALTKDTVIVTTDREALIGLKSFTGATDIDTGSLKVPSESLYQLVLVAHEVTDTQGESALCDNGVLRAYFECSIELSHL